MQRVGGFLLFLLYGTLLGTWTARIPAVKQHLGLSDSRLSLALLAFAAGAVVGMQLAGWLVDRFGARTVMVPAAATDSVILVLPALAPNLAALAVSLFVFGTVHGTLNIAMNARAVAIQRARGQAGISMFHAVYSVGGFLGAGIGGLFAGLALVPTTTFASVALGGLAITAMVWAMSKNVQTETAGAQATTDAGDKTATGDTAGSADLVGTADTTAGTRSTTGTGDATGTGDIAIAGERTVRRGEAAAPGDAGRFRGLLFLGVLVFCCLVGEGAAADWSSVYLREDLHSAPGFAAAAYAAFSLMMMAGRLVGDRLTAAVGPVRLVFGSGLLAAVGLSAGLLVDDPVGAVVGFGLFGAGLSCIAPQVFAAAGNRDPARAGSAIARVAGLGFLGFVVGPVVIGAVARLVHLHIALGIPAVLALFVALSARAVAPSQSIVVGRERPTSGSIGGTLS